MKFVTRTNSVQHQSTVLLIVSSRVISFLAFPNASILPDSGSYAPKGFLDFSLVSLSGHSVRGWPTPLLFALLPNNSFRILSLLTISAVCWAYLAKVLLKRVEGEKRKWLTVLAIASISCSPNIIQWDNAILGQSLLLSNVVVLVALVINYFGPHRNWKIAPLIILTSSFLVIQKSSNTPIFLIVTSLVISLGWMERTNLKNAFLVVLMIICSIYSFSVGIQVDKFWSDVTYSGKSVLWSLGGQSPAAMDFKRYLASETDAPPCIYLDAPYANIDIDMSKVINSCPESHKYIRDVITYDFIKFLASNPKDIVKLEAIGFGASLSNSASNYGRAVGILPTGFYSITQGGVNPDLRFTKSQDQIQAFNALKTGEPIWIFAPGLLWILLSILTLVSKIKSSERHRNEYYFSIPIAILLIESSFTFIILPSEWVRSTSAYLPLAILISIWYLVINLKPSESSQK